MRNKIIAVNAVIVLIVGLLAFAIVRTQLAAETSSTDQLKRTAQRDVAGAAAQLQLDALRAERWLAIKANEPATRAALGKATPDARGDAARQLCDQIASAASGALGAKPSIVAVVDNSGKIVGRNGSDLNRGEDIGSAYPAFKEAITKAQSGSDVWTDKARADQYIASYVPVKDESRAAGMLLIGIAINDALARVGDITTGRGVLLVSSAGDVVANSGNAGEDVKNAVKASVQDVKNSLSTGNVVASGNGDIIFASAPLAGMGDGHRTAAVAAAPTSLLPGANAIPISILGVMALGLILVIAGGWFLGNYISRPIAALEEGLLMILNGQTDKRFELDHAELGGLAFRIDQLLNQLMGVEEDNTDDEGRVSKAPTAANFGDALSVDKSGQSQATGASDVDAAKLAAEPTDAYYARLYREYIAAKKALNEQVDHITDAAFKSRIQGMETDASAKHGRPVRYHVQSNGREVVLLAVPL